MKLDPQRIEPLPEADDERDRLDVDIAWDFGARGFGHRQRISGPEGTVREIVDLDNRELIRWGVFVLTFVPTATTLIAKLPEIITALSNAFGERPISKDAQDKILIYPLYPC